MQWTCPWLWEWTLTKGSERPVSRSTQAVSSSHRTVPWKARSSKAGGDITNDNRARTAHTMPLRETNGSCSLFAQCAFPAANYSEDHADRRPWAQHLWQSRLRPPAAASCLKEVQYEFWFLPPGLHQSFLCEVIFSSVGQIKLWSLIVNLDVIIYYFVL